MPTSMRRFGRAITLYTWLLAGPGLACAQEALQLQRQDQGLVQATAFAPKGQTCRAIAIISPGAGGSAQGYRYLGEALSAQGHLAVVVGHEESGLRALQQQVRNSGLRDGLAALIVEPQAYSGRLMDLSAAKRWAQSHCPNAASVLIGHSMGAATAMIEAGARNQLGAQGADSFDAYIALSPQGVGTIFPENAWSEIQKPVLLLTGTRDTELGGLSWETRTQPFSALPPGCKWLAVIEDATHMHFAGKGLSRKTETLALQTIAAFLTGVQTGQCKPAPRVPGMELSTK